MIYKFSKISITLPEQHVSSISLQTDLKMCIEIKRVKHDKANLKKKDKVEFILRYFKIHCQTGNQDCGSGVQQNLEARNRSTLLLSTDFKQRNQSNPMKKDRIFQQMVFKQLAIYLGARR